MLGDRGPGPRPSRAVSPRAGARPFLEAPPLAPTAGRVRGLPCFGFFRRLRAVSQPGWPLLLPAASPASTRVAALGSRAGRRGRAPSHGGDTCLGPGHLEGEKDSWSRRGGAFLRHAPAWRTTYLGTPAAASVGPAGRWHLPGAPLWLLEMECLVIRFSRIGGCPSQSLYFGSVQSLSRVRLLATP